MGNTAPKPHNNNHYVHPRLGNISRIQQSSQQPYLIYQLVLESDKLYEEWTRELGKVKEIEEDVLFLPFKHRYEQTNFCGSGGVAILNYEDYLYSLEPQITNRREIKRPFNEQELLYLFYSLVKAEALLEGKGKTVGDIRPENILVNEDGYVKILSQYSYPSEPNRIVGWSKGQERSFPSPEECEQRHKRKEPSTDNLDKNQCEVFSIGMTILQAGSLKDCSEIYGFAVQSRPSQQKLRHFIDIFENRYSQQFSYLVREMLNINPRKRIRAQTVYDRLKPYEHYILNLEEVEIKIPNQFIPKVEREEKISIKKLGQSQTSQAFSQQESVRNSGMHVREGTYAKISLGSNNKNPQPFVSQMVPSQEQNPFSKSLESGSYHPGRQSNPYPQAPPPAPINHQLIVEQTNFKRQASSSVNQSGAYQLYNVAQKPSMMKSMQVGNPQCEPSMMKSMQVGSPQYESQSTSPQYITQKSMVQNMGRNSELPFANF